MKGLRSRPSVWTVNQLAHPPKRGRSPPRCRSPARGRAASAPLRRRPEGVRAGEQGRARCVEAALTGRHAISSAIAARQRRSSGCPRHFGLQRSRMLLGTSLPAVVSRATSISPGSKRSPGARPARPSRRRRSPSVPPATAWRRNTRRGATPSPAPEPSCPQRGSARQLSPRSFAKPNATNEPSASTTSGRSEPLNGSALTNKRQQAPSRQPGRIATRSGEARSVAEPVGPRLLAAMPSVRQARSAEARFRARRRCSSQRRWHRQRRWCRPK